MKKLLSADDPAPAVASMQAAGVLMRVLPGADSASLAVLVHHEAALDVVADPLRRLAVLGALEADSRLRLSRAESAKLDLLQRLTGDTSGLAEVAWRHGADCARDVALLRAAALGEEIAFDLDAQIELGVAAVFPVAAADLMPDFTGPALGAKLAELEAQWIASGFSLDKAALLA